MAAVSIRDLDERVRERLKVRAARNGRSMEAEIRAILSDSVSEQSEREGLGAALLSQFGAIGGVDLDLPAREIQPRSPDLSS